MQLPGCDSCRTQCELYDTVVLVTAHVFVNVFQYVLQIEPMVHIIFKSACFLEGYKHDYYFNSLSISKTSCQFFITVWRNFNLIYSSVTNPTLFDIWLFTIGNPYKYYNKQFQLFLCAYMW